MPPSGYSQGQADSIRNFLISCAEALHTEANQNGETLMRALDRELSDIIFYSESKKIVETQFATLQLTLLFYQKIKDQTPKNSDEFWRAVERTTTSMCSEILAVKIPQRVDRLAREFDASVS